MPDPLPLTWPVTAEQVRQFTDTTDEGTDGSLAQAVEAVNAYVPGLSSLKGFWTEPEEPAEPEFAPTADVILGACMLASRLHARRGNQLGTSGFGEFAVGSILRYDPDVKRLLRLDAFTFGAPTPAVVEDEVV